MKRKAARKRAKAAVRPVKRAPAKPKAPAKRPGAPAPRTTAAGDAREQAALEAAKYTPGPLKSDGWPPFRYPLP